MYDLTSDDFEDLGMATEIFAEREMIADMREADSHGWHVVTSSFFKLDGVLGYAVGYYCESVGFEGATFESLVEVPLDQLKRGPVPKNQVKIEGVRYYNPFN